MRHRGILVRLAAVVLVAGGLSACGPGDTPLVAYAPPSYDHLTPLRLNVVSLDIDDSWTPRPDSRDLGARAPVPPIAALRQMARDRLMASGNSGHGVFVIDDASLVQSRDRYEGRLVVHLDVTTSDGTRSGYAEARVQRTQSIVNDQPNAARAELNAFVVKMMQDMNVELEFQIKRSLRSYLAPATTTVPAAAPVIEESLPPPPKI
jgi:hypothetical protein